MLYYISNEQADCPNWATIKISDNGNIETVGCHVEMNDAVGQMIALSLDEGSEPGGEYSVNQNMNNMIRRAAGR